MTHDEKIVEAVAEALWQADSERAAGRRRLSEWRDESEETRNQWRFMARAAITAYQAEAWQPIETAPTNTAIQIHCPDLDYYGNQGCYAGMLVDMGTGKRWMTFGWAMGRDLGPESQPSAWRPLPNPPASP